MSTVLNFSLATYEEMLKDMQFAFLRQFVQRFKDNIPDSDDITIRRREYKLACIRFYTALKTAPDIPLDIVFTVFKELEAVYTSDIDLEYKL